MENYCAFNKNHKCMKLMDYELIRQKLEETDSLCHGTWIKIQRLTERINILEPLLREVGIDVPNDF